MISYSKAECVLPEFCISCSNQNFVCLMVHVYLFLIQIYSCDYLKQSLVLKTMADKLFCQDYRIEIYYLCGLNHISKSYIKHIFILIIMGEGTLRRELSDSYCAHE